MRGLKGGNSPPMASFSEEERTESESSCLPRILEEEQSLYESESDLESELDSEPESEPESEHESEPEPSPPPPRTRLSLCMHPLSAGWNSEGTSCI